jgi:signal transduction histidine kinase
MTIRAQLILGFCILILVFIVVYVVNQRLSREVLRNTSYLNNSEAVIRNSNMLHKRMIEMQSGFRGFLLTNQDVFLAPYYTGLSSVPPLMNEQRALLSTARQREKLDSIAILHKRWLIFADSLISAKKDTLPEGGRKYHRLFEKNLRTEVGKKLNDQIRQMFEKLDNNEYALRQERQAALQNSLENTRNMSLGLTIGSVLLAVCAGIYFIRIITGRIDKMVTLAQRISTGSFITIVDNKRDELTNLVNSLNQMSQTLQKNFHDLRTKNRELDQFAFVVSHDLKAPLRGITNLILWMEEDHHATITPEIKRNLDLIKGRTDRLENMINGLLEYARVGKLKRGAEWVDVGLLLSEIRELIVPSHVQFRTQGRIPVIYTERLLLEQVFTNLISNAFKHNTSTSPEVLVSCTKRDEHYIFSVSDNGQGIEERYFEKIFDIFQTLQERDAFESTGVGLAIVKKIVEDQKGDIYVTSELGKGSTFTFTWPVTEPGTTNEHEEESTADRG